MIEITYGGGLGNRMCLRAAAEIISSETGLFVNDHFESRDLAQLGKIIPSSLGRKKNNTKRNPVEINDLSMPTKNHFLDYVRDPSIDSIHISGYLQKAWLYLDYRKKLKSFFKFPPIDIEILSDHVALCIRRGDQISTRGHPCLIPYEYYNYVIQEFFPTNPLYIITDTPNDPDVLKIKDKHNVWGCSGSDAISDLSLITNFSNIVGGIGTFHWWGIFLSAANCVFLPIPPDGWGFGRPPYSSFSDLHLPFANYVHNSLYMG